jgi:P-type Mg2+ transporter
MASVDQARSMPGPRAWDSQLALASAAALPAADVLERLESTAAGLSHDEASARLAEVGANALRSHGARPLAVLVRQLRNPLLILLVAAALTSFAVGERTSALIILLIICMSVGLGFFNSNRSAEDVHGSRGHQ